MRCDGRNSKKKLWSLISIVVPSEKICGKSLIYISICSRYNGNMVIIMITIIIIILTILTRSTVIIAIIIIIIIVLLIIKISTKVIIISIKSSFLKLEFTLCTAKQPLQGKKLQEKRRKKG